MPASRSGFECDNVGDQGCDLSVSAAARRRGRLSKPFSASLCRLPEASPSVRSAIIWSVSLLAQVLSNQPWTDRQQSEDRRQWGNRAHWAIVDGWIIDAIASSGARQRTGRVDRLFSQDDKDRDHKVRDDRSRDNGDRDCRDPSGVQFRPCLFRSVGAEAGCHILPSPVSWDREGPAKARPTVSAAGSAFQKTQFSAV